jgi:hypothetical protein
MSGRFQAQSAQFRVCLHPLKLSAIVVPEGSGVHFRSSTAHAVDEIKQISLNQFGCVFRQLVFVEPVAACAFAERDLIQFLTMVFVVFLHRSTLSPF